LHYQFSRNQSPLPDDLLSFKFLQSAISSSEWSCSSVKASISVVDILIRHPRCGVFKLLRISFFIRLKLENPRSQSTLVAGRTAMIWHNLQSKRM
jgi:hypothetical protein